MQQPAIALKLIAHYNNRMMTMPPPRESGGNDTFSFLERICNIVHSPLEPEDVLAPLVNELVTGLAVDACWIQLLIPERADLAKDYF